jgi:hypothetical protein
MSEATRKAIRPELPDFCVNALVITSRTEETLGKVTKTTLKPLRIEGNRLSSFMEAYLTQRGKRDRFTDTEFFDACSRLSAMVGAAKHHCPACQVVRRTADCYQGQHNWRGNTGVASTAA